MSPVNVFYSTKGKTPPTFPSFRMKHILSKLKEDAIDQETLISNLEYVSEVMHAVVNKTE